MSLATVRSCALSGIRALSVTVEVYLGGGLPGMTLVGLPQSAVRESKDRVRAAIRHAGYNYPQVKIVVNLAPADLPKRGGRFDLPIAIGILMASGQVPPDATEGLVIVGELGLGGELRPVEGALPSAEGARAAGSALLLPAANRKEALRVGGVAVTGAATLRDACVALSLDETRCLRVPDTDDPGSSRRQGQGQGQGLEREAAPLLADLADVIGQDAARRALEVAAAGGHNLLLCGAPGTGKSMLASRLPGILPAMDETQASEVAAIASISHLGFDPDRWGERPFRAPHHTVSGIALIGGGSPPLPGEVSLAHNGVLFLDELTEFRRSVLEVLREPMETGHVAVSRSSFQADFPARFQLVAAMNPCPCGLHDETGGDCVCTPQQILQYRSRVSSPFLDRIDIHVQVRREALTLASLDAVLQPGAQAGSALPESSARVRARCRAARARQLARQGCSNAVLRPGSLAGVCDLDADSRVLLERAAKRLDLSLRGVHRVLRVARTIADLDDAAMLTVAHLSEAIAYRERMRVPPVPRVDEVMTMRATRHED